LSVPSVVSNQLALDPKNGRLSASLLLLFEDHSDERAAGPIDLDEVHDQIEQETEEPPEMPVMLPNDSDPSRGVTVDKKGVPGALSLVSPDDPDPKRGAARDKGCFTETSSAFSVSMGERRTRRRSSKCRSSKCRPSGVHGEFARLKHIVLVTMMCVVVGSGIIEHWFGRSLCAPPSVHRARPVLPTPIVDEESPKRQRRAKKENRKREVDFDIDELLFTLW
jgi:hypothetical protein